MSENPPVAQSENQKAPVVKTALWQFFGSLFLEPKKHPQTGEEHLALGLTRVMSLTLFLAVLWLWMRAGGGTPSTEPVPESMLHTLWGLLGLKGIGNLAETLRKPQ